MNVIVLTAVDLTIAAYLVMILAVLSAWLQLGLGKKIVIAGVRTTVQLLLIGFVLKVLFEQSHLTWISLLAMVMLLVAGREVMARQKRRFGGWWGFGLGTMTMFVSSFSITVFVLLMIIQNDPWYKPQYAIPLLGMMLGNTMTGIALALDRLTDSAWQQRGVIEAQLSLGYDWRSAIRGMARDSVRVGLVPMLNAMAAAGLVSLPGMMTGQILSGTPPLEAVKYQILIMFMITAGTGFATMGAVWIGAKHLFDERQRLRLDRIKS
jgi:putative ABC transport system permease protein